MIVHFSFAYQLFLVIRQLTNYHKKENNKMLKDSVCIVWRREARSQDFSRRTMGNFEKWKGEAEGAVSHKYEIYNVKSYIENIFSSRDRLACVQETNVCHRSQQVSVVGNELSKHKHFGQNYILKDSYIKN